MTFGVLGRRGGWVCPLVLPTAMACAAEGGGGTAGTAVVRDSAGITIVENLVADPAGIPRWSIDTIPRLSIGVDSGDAAYEFARIGGVYRLPNGMILVLHGPGESAYEFRFFDSTGKHIATHGRRGEGPGDFRSIAFVGSAGGDTVVAVDFPNSRLNWVSATAGYLRSTRVDHDRFRELIDEDASGMLEDVVPLGDSLLAVKANRPIPGATYLFQQSNSFGLVDLAAGRATRLAQYDEPGVKSIRLSTRTYNFMESGGRPVHVVDRQRGRICAGRTSVTEISCLDADGTRWRIRWRTDTLPFTDEDRRQSEENIRASFTRQRYTEADVQKLFAARGWPEHHLPFSVLQLDTDGNLWIFEPVLDDQKTRRSRFRVLDPDGKLIAFADSLPTRLALGRRSHIGTTDVVLAYETAEGIPAVGVFAIDKRGRR